VGIMERDPIQTPATTGEKQPSFELAAENTTEIEDLTVSDQAMVQVFQLEEGAPMIIYIDETADSNGVTL